ncbi:MAG: hypothetical protein ACQEVA_10995 [Myxococcota bacterium]
MKLNDWPLWRTFFLLLALLFCASGCDRPATAASISPGESEEVVYYAAGCEDFTVPQGFELHWEWFNHRISYLKMRPADRRKCQPEHLEAGFIGGSFSTGAYFEDTPHVSYLYQPITSETPDKMAASRVTLTVEIGPDGKTTGTQQLSRDRLALADYDEVVALIEGVSFHTGIEQNTKYPTKYDPANGYTMRGIGAETRISALNPEDIELEYMLRFETGIAPDWRPNMNEARNHAVVRGHLDVLLIGLNEAPTHREQVSYDVAYPEPTFGNRKQTPPNGEMIETAVNGTPGRSPGFAGLSRWDFDMEFPIECDDNSDCPGGETCIEDRARCTNKQGPLGDYIKTLQVSVKQTDYDPETGEAGFEVVGYASNSSSGIVFAPLEYHFDSELVWVQADGAAQPREIVRNRFDTGETSIVLENGEFESKSQQASAEPKRDAESEKETAID